MNKPPADQTDFFSQPPPFGSPAKPGDAAAHSATADLVARALDRQLVPVLQKLEARLDAVEKAIKGLGPALKDDLSGRMRGHVQEAAAETNGAVREVGRAVAAASATVQQHLATFASAQTASQESTVRAVGEMAGDIQRHLHGHEKKPRAGLSGKRSVGWAVLAVIGLTGLGIVAGLCVSAAGLWPYRFG